MEVALTPTLGSEINGLKRRIVQLERLQQYRPTAIPCVEFGTDRDFGYRSTSSTSYTNVLRGDTICSAPTLQYSFQVADGWGTSITSIDWKLAAYKYSDESWVTLETGSDVGGTSFSGLIDIFDALGEDAFNQFIRIHLDVKRTGGSGDAAIRLLHPFLLRIKEVS